MSRPRNSVTPVGEVRAEALDLYAHGWTKREIAARLGLDSRALAFLHKPGPADVRAARLHRLLLRRNSLLGRRADTFLRKRRVRLGAANLVRVLPHLTEAEALQLIEAVEQHGGALDFLIRLVVDHLAAHQFGAAAMPPPPPAARRPAMP